MTGEIVNLRKARKARDRAAREARAAENRIAFGRPRAERDALHARAELETRRLEGHRLADAPAQEEEAPPPAPGPGTGGR